MDRNTFRAFMTAASDLPAIGDFYEGGYFAGLISHTANGVPTHGLVIAPASSGYNNKNTLAWKTNQNIDIALNSATSVYNGAANSAALNSASYPAVQYCKGLTINGYTDWYLPARAELDIAYHNLKPSATNNDTSFGINDYSVPKRTTNRTADFPGASNLAVFQDGGAEAFALGSIDGVDGVHWSSTYSRRDQASFYYAFGVRFDSGAFLEGVVTGEAYVRAFRKFAL